jgi:hypothetical protein
MDSKAPNDMFGGHFECFIEEVKIYLDSMAIEDLPNLKFWVKFGKKFRPFVWQYRAKF